MDKFIYNKKNGLWYELLGDYYIPCLKLPKERTAHIGVWGRCHLKFLKQHHKVRYYNLLTNGMLNDYLADIDLQAEKMFAHLVKQMAECKGLTEQLKADAPITWVRRMNNIRNRATDVVSASMIYL